MKRTGLWLVALAGLLLANATGAAEEWKEFVSREGAFAAMLPGTPKLEKEVEVSRFGRMESYHYRLEGVEPPLAYVVMCLDGPRRWLTAKQIQDDLDHMRDTAVGREPGSTLKSEK